MTWHYGFDVRPADGERVLIDVDDHALGMWYATWTLNNGRPLWSFLRSPQHEVSNIPVPVACHLLDSGVLAMRWTESPLRMGVTQL